MNNMPITKDYLLKNIENFTKMKETNAEKMKEMVSQSQALQVEYNTLESSNKFIEALLNEIQQLKEGETIGTENIQST